MNNNENNNKNVEIYIDREGFDIIIRFSDNRQPIYTSLDANDPISDEELTDIVYKVYNI